MISDVTRVSRDGRGRTAPGDTLHVVTPEGKQLWLNLQRKNCKKLKFKIECKGQIYKTAEIILLCHKILCLFCTVIFTSELIAKTHSLSCHYKCDYSILTYVVIGAKFRRNRTIGSRIMTSYRIFKMAAIESENISFRVWV